MRKLMMALVATSLLLAGCADPPNESEQFGIDEVSKSAQTRLTAFGGTDVREACQTEVEELPEERLASLDRDDVINGCVRALSNDES